MLGNICREIKKYVQGKNEEKMEGEEGKREKEEKGRKKKREEGKKEKEGKLIRVVPYTEFEAGFQIPCNPVLKKPDPDIRADIR